MSDAQVAPGAGGLASSNPAPEVQEAQTAPALPQKIKLKIDGQEQEVALDELTRDYSKYKGSEKRFQEAARFRKEAEQKERLVQDFLQKAQSGDLSWLKGMVPQDQLKHWAESQLLEHLEWEGLHPSEKRARLAEQENAKYKAYLEEQKTQEDVRHRTSLEQKASVDIEADIVGAVKELGYDIKVTPRLIRRIAENMYASLEALDENDPHARPISAKIAKDKAFDSLKSDAQELLSVLPEDQVIAMLPPKLRQAIRRLDVKEATEQFPARMREQSGQPASPSRKQQPKSIEKTFEEIAKRWG